MRRKRSWRGKGTERLALGLLFCAPAGCKAGAAAAADIDATPAASTGAFHSPLDSVPSSDGRTFYFLAQSDEGGTGVFTAPASGGDATPLAVGAPLVAPIGITIAADDQTLYVADSEAEIDADREGALFTLPVAGGAPALLMGSEGTRPRAVDVDPTGKLVFTGRTADGAPALYQIDPAGGAATVLVQGDPLADPSGVAVSKRGEIFVADSGDLAGRIVSIKDGAMTVVAGNLHVGYPAGVALTADDSTLLVSGHAATEGTSVVYAVSLATHEISVVSSGIGQNLDSGGLHRARANNTFSWCGTTAGDRGTVYRVTLK